MAQIPALDFFLDLEDLEDLEGTAYQSIPPDLAEKLDLITELKPDGGKIHYLETLRATFAVLMKNETRPDKLHGQNWTDRKVKVQNQGPHKTCWSTSGSENISDARHIHKVDMEYTPYSGQYLTDFVDLERANSRLAFTKGRHYCYGYSSFGGLQYAMNHGIPRRDDWNGSKCGNHRFPDGVLGDNVRLKHVLNDVKTFCGVNKALDYLIIQPILGSLAIFYPEFKNIKGGIYRGPESKRSHFRAWHAVSIRNIEMENGETIAFVKNSHGLESGVGGYVKVSMDVVLLELQKDTQRDDATFPFPCRLFRSFTYGEVRTEYEKEVVECYVDGEKNNDQVSKKTASKILEGIFNNTSGKVFEYEDGETEIIGSPIDRAIFKWAIQLQSKMDFRYSKSSSSTITGSPCNLKPLCRGIVVNVQKTGKCSVRIHWKGKAEFLLGKCTKYDSNGVSLKMSESKRTELTDAVNDMAARDLICIAFACKEITKKRIPRKKKAILEWVLPCEDLVLLAIFGIKNPCLKADDEKQASLDFEVEVEQDDCKINLDHLTNMVDAAICYDQVSVRDFVPSALGFLMNKEPETVRNFISKAKSQLGEGKVSHDPVRNHETLIADFCESAIGRVASIDSGFCWITSIRLILSLCVSEGFDIFHTLLCADGCCLIDRRTGVYGYPIEIQALFFMALRCAVLPLLKEDGEGTEMVEQIIKQLHALRRYFWLDLQQRNDIYRYKTEEHSHSAVNKFSVIPDSLPEWIFNYMPPHGVLFVGNVSPTRMDSSWFAFGNCIAMFSSLVTPEHFTAIIDLIESRWEELVGEMPLKVCYPAIGSHEWRIITGCDPKNTRWSYHNGDSWPVLIWLLMATCIKTGRPQIARRAIELARKCQNWSIAGYSVQSPGQATGYVGEERNCCGLSSSAKSGKVDAMFEVFVRDFVPSALAFLMNKEPEIVRNFILKTKRQSWEKKIDRFQLGGGVMPASFKVSHDPVRNHETLIADFCESAIGRVALVDSGFWWITLLRAYTKSIKCQKSIRLILSLCVSEGFDIFHTLLCADGCCLIDRRTGVYGYPIEIQALFFMALRCAVLPLLKEDREGTEMVEQIIKQLHALRRYFWLDLQQRNDIYRYKTEEHSHSAVNKFSVIPDSLPEWIFNYMPPHGVLFVGNVSPTRMDSSWFAFGNCVAMFSSLATPEHFTAIIDLIESLWEELVGEMPLKVCYPAIGSHEWRIITGCDPKNTRWSYHNGDSWPVLIWLLMATCIKTGRPQIARRAIELARKCQNWSIAGYSVQSPGQATGYVGEERNCCGLSSSAKSGKVDAMFEVFVRDFVPSALAFLMNKEPEIVRNFILKTKRQSWEKKIDRFQLGGGVMPASFKVSHDPVRNHETLIADFCESAIGRVALVDSGFWWITLLRAYTKSIKCQKSIRLILSLCVSEGFDIFHTLLCADGCCLIDRRTGVYGYPIEIQALFFMALRCAVLPLLKEDREGTEMVEQIIKQLHALRRYFWLDLQQRNDIYRYKTEEHSHSAVNKFSVIPDSLPEWIFNYMPPHGVLFVGNVSPTRMDSSWFAFGNCVAMFSSLATPEHFTAIIDLIESLWEELVGEMPLKVCYPAIGSHEWRIITGCDPKNTRWSYHNGNSWPVLIWLLMATCIKTGRPQIARRAIELARKCQNWSIAGYSVQSPGQATGYVDSNCGLSSSATSGKADAMFEV